jgi:hypothetical protein
VIRNLGPAIEALILVVLLAGCSKEPPLCSDESSLNSLRALISEELKSNLTLTPQDLIENLRFDLPLATAYDENIKKRTCQLKLAAGTDFSTNLSYSFQIDDKGAVIVGFFGMSRLELYSIKNHLEEAVRKEREETNGATPSEPSVASFPATAAVVPSEFLGSWSGDTTAMTVIKEGSGYQATLSTGTASGCTGELSAPATMFGSDMMVISAKAEDAVCTVTVRFSVGGNANMSEGDACSGWHGVSCGFTGELTRKP